LEKYRNERIWDAVETEETLQWVTDKFYSGVEEYDSLRFLKERGQLDLGKKVPEQELERLLEEVKSYVQDFLGLELEANPEIGYTRIFEINDPYAWAVFGLLSGALVAGVVPEREGYFGSMFFAVAAFLFFSEKLGHKVLAPDAYIKSKNRICLSRKPELTLISTIAHEYTHAVQAVVSTNLMERIYRSIIEGIAIGTQLAVMRTLGEEKDDLAYTFCAKKFEMNILAVSYYYLRTALFDQSKVDYRGTLVIKPHAQQTDSYLAHHTLMLSPKARTETEPCLEIEADNVAAGHAATIGRVDEDMLFYLRSRGISTPEAHQMLIQGFMQADLQKIPNTELRKALAEEIQKFI
jgi:hypothetical protein